MKRTINPMAIVFAILLAAMFYRQAAASSGGIMDWIMQRIYMLPAIVIGLSFHEFGHAYVADKLGDPTARNYGRVTINPMAHMDPIGFLCVFMAGFGWGIPVPVDDRNFKNPKQGNMLVTLAGVTVNLAIAIIFTLVLRVWITFAGNSMEGMYGVVYTMLQDVVVINIVLMVFNLLPVPPLDGFMLVTEAFNLKKYSWWYIIYANGFLILMVCVLFGAVQGVLNPLVYAILDLLTKLL